ncbi:hypothetical protein ACFW5I_24725 [Streptomyces sp. NPDC058818]|uniref:hypothetical protein n=1 Tax=Streptomyces sp. NPDC058818 TaxID=3346640 RepID=UPI0036CBA1A7
MDVSQIAKRFPLVARPVQHARRGHQHPGVANLPSSSGMNTDEPKDTPQGIDTLALF